MTAPTMTTAELLAKLTPDMRAEIRAAVAAEPPLSPEVVSDLRTIIWRASAWSRVGPVIAEGNR